MNTFAVFDDIETFQRGCATIETSDHCFNDVVKLHYITYMMARLLFLNK